MNSSQINSQLMLWGDSKEEIRAMILTGSHAEKKPSDSLSDLDIALFCSDTKHFLESDNWLNDIAPLWVVIHEQYVLMEESIPTRLAIFEGGLKVDFSFFPVKFLDKLKSEGLPDAFNVGYKVILDKDGVTQKLPLPTFEGFKEGRPSEEEFLAIIKEFWFEVYHVAKYLCRKDLWSVQFRINSIHHHILLKMICWNESAKNSWNYTTHNIGKKMREWVCENTWDALHHIFPHFDAQDGWKALIHTMDLFERLSHETAQHLGYSDLPPDLKQNMKEFVILQRKKSAPDECNRF